MEEETLPCADKLVFESEQDAQATANVAHYRYGGHVRPYQCKHCNYWHLASAA